LGDTVFIDTLKKVGITSTKNNVSLPLGTSEMNIIELTNGYSTLASTNRKEPYLIRAVKDNKNNLLYEHRIKKKKVLDSNYSYILSELLTNCYDNNLIDYSEPTCLSIKPKLTKTYAIKTGSTNTDSLIVGYNKDYTLGIWVGYDDNKKLEKSDSKIARNIWADTMENYLRNKKQR
jgi:membrane peptidoglycan carboxypeptidase